jgi:hypothetical protein
MTDNIPVNDHTDYSSHRNDCECEFCYPPTTIDNELDDVFYDIRLTCQECEHPRCVELANRSRRNIEALITTHQNQLLDRLLEELPKSRELYHDPPAQNGDWYDSGFNAYHTQAVEAIKKMRTE